LQQLGWWLLDCKTTVAEVEARYPDRADRPVDRFHRHWEALKAAMQPGDEIYLYHSTPEASGFLAWQRGYVLVRDGKVIRKVLTYELRPGPFCSMQPGQSNQAQTQ
jgi:hypothetical protein